MKDFSYSVLMIALGWAIPLILAWLWPKITGLKDHPFLANVILSLLFAISVSTTTVFVYDRFFVVRTKNIVAITYEGGSCPQGFRNMNTALLPRWKEAPERFQVQKDIRLEGDWPIDHVLLCLSTPD